MVNGESGVRGLTVHGLVVVTNLTLRDTPRPANNAWCCNKELSDEDAFSFGDVQCQEHNEYDIM
jgi:hypothetical protein